MQFVLHVSYYIFLFFYFSLFAAICSFVFLWLCCCHALAWWLRLPTISHRKALQKENIQRGVVYNICAPQRLNRNGGRQKTPYLACTESLRLGEVVAKGKRKAFIKVSTRKAPNPHHPLTASQPESMLQNPPKPDPLTSYQLFNLPLLYNHSCLQGLPGQL